MSVHAGNILHVGGNNVIDRIQSAGLGDVRVPTEVIREVGNTEVVDKVPGDADFTFTLESFDVSTELEAFLNGKIGGAGSAAAPGASDPAGTVYSWANTQFLNIPSPWKNPATGSAGTVEAGHLVPGYYPTRMRYRFGVTDNATQEVEMSGGSYYYADGAPVEQIATGDGATTAFVTDNVAIPHRRGGVDGTTFRSVFGVIIDGALAIEGVDYTQSPSNTATPGVATVTFTTAPHGVDATHATAAQIRFAYFTTAAMSYPQAVHASTLVKPGAVRGRNICVYINGAKVGGVQAFELEASVEGDVVREFCNEEIIGREVNGRDCTGSVTIRAKDKAAFIALLSTITGVAATEVFGYLNQHAVELEVKIQNPKNPAEILKSLYVDDAIFQVPGTPARVNTPVDFQLRWESRSGTYDAIKGARA
jgi:hypothetical protein